MAIRWNRKRLSVLLTIVVVAALLAVYVLYSRSRQALPNQPPGSPAQSSVPQMPDHPVANAARDAVPRAGAQAGPDLLAGDHVDSC